MQIVTQAPAVTLLPANWRRPLAAAPTPTQRLPFTVRVARGALDLAAVADLRVRAYGRHLPQTRAQLQAPEPADHAPDTRVLMAECSTDGRLLGTLRLQQRGSQPLPLEASVSLPGWLQAARVVESARLCIDQGAPESVRWALFKASYLHSLDTRADWMVVTARRPLARLYERLLFCDLLDAGTMVPMQHIAGVPHRVMGLSIRDAADAWAACGHPMRDFMLRTRHPDIRL